VSERLAEVYIQRDR